jgi:DNA polymerase-1
MTTLIADVETDGLLPEMTKLWMVQIGDADTDEVTIYADQPGFPPIIDGINRLKAADFYVFHNGLGFDMEAINRFHPGAIVREKLLDTLLMSRLAHPDERQHSLKAWGLRLGCHKGDYTGDFQTFDDVLVTYARQDIVVGRAIYHKLKHTLGWGTSYTLERDITVILGLMEQNGFTLDLPRAQLLESRLRGEVEKLNEELQALFPPLCRETPFTPKVNNKTLGYRKGVPMIKRKMEAFNPSSRAHIAERLQMLGWKPKDDAYGADGIPTCDEKVLSAMKHPVAAVLLRYLSLDKMLGQLSDGKNGWLRLVKANGRVHGRVTATGTVTSRMSHSKPNMAQVSKKDPEMRACWKARDGWVLVGCDGEGIQARVVGHYLARYDGGATAEAIAHGDKSLGTDVHTLNQKAISKIAEITRDGAKTALYAKLFGSSPAGLGCTLTQACRDAGTRVPRLPLAELGNLVNAALATSMKGLDKLEESAQAKVATHKYLVTLDGRKLPVTSKRLALVTLAQGGEACIMKLAACIFHFEAAPTLGWVHGVDYGFCAFVHDEVQTECRPEIATQLGEVMADCITQSGVRLGVRCHLAGSYDIGANWHETH